MFVWASRAEHFAKLGTIFELRDTIRLKEIEKCPYYQREVVRVLFLLSRAEYLFSVT